MTKEQAIERIYFLRARTVENGCTENEANIAMQVLNGIMKDFNMTLTEAEILKDEMVCVQLEADSRQPIHQLCHAIGLYTDTKQWYSTGKRLILYNFLGTKEDALNAQYLFAMLNASIGFELRKFSKGKGRDAQRDEGFKRGMCARLSERLREMKRETEREVIVNNDEQYSLIIKTKQQKIKEEMENAGIVLTAVSDRRRYDSSSFESGYKKGGDIQINKGIADNPQTRKQLK